MRKIYLLIIFIFIICPGCFDSSVHSPSPINTIKIEDDIKPIQFDIASICDSVNYIILQNNKDKDFTIGQIDKVIVHNAKIFVLDKRITRSVFCFDSLGHPLSKIAAGIGGPGEFLSLDDMSIENDSIYVLSTAMKRIFVYNNESKFIREIHLDEFYNNIDVITKNIMLSRIPANAGGDKLNGASLCTFSVQTPEDKKVLLPFTSSTNYLSFMHDEYPVSRNDSSIYFSRYYGDTLYSFNAYTKSIDKIYVDFGAKKIPNRFKRIINENKFIEKVNGAEFRYLCNNYMNNGKLFVFAFSAGADLLYYLNVKQKNKHFIFKQVYNSKDNIPLDFNAFTSNSFVSVLPPEFIKGNKESILNKKPEANHRLFSILKNYNLDEINPVIAIARIK